MFGVFKRKPNAKTVLREVLRNVSIPSFSENVLEGLRVLRDPERSLTSIAETLCSDPGLSVQILRTANSSVYGLRHPVKNVHHAVSLLGRPEVEALLLSVGVKGALPKRSAPGYEPRQFWQAAFQRATLARSLAAELHPATASESFTAALLQDMALPFLAHARGAHHGKLIERSQAGDGDLCTLEREAFGWDHTRVAEAICLEWKFPDGLLQAIASHHDADASERGVPLAIPLVARLTECRGLDTIDDMVADAHELTGLSVERLKEIFETSIAEAADLAWSTSG